MSGAKSAIRVCLLLPRMLSDFLKACTDTTELRFPTHIDPSLQILGCPHPCHGAQRLVAWNTKGLTDAFQLSLHIWLTLCEPDQGGVCTGVDNCRHKHTCICLTYLSSIGSAYRSNARAFFTGSLSSRAFASALDNIWTRASHAADLKLLNVCCEELRQRELPYRRRCHCHWQDHGRCSS